jgi:hypothetical protein
MAQLEDIHDGGRLVRQDLAGVQVKHGDVMNVTWPDGTVERVRVSIIDGLGGPEDGARAMACVQYHGVPAVVELAGVDLAFATARCNCSDGTCPACQEAWKKSAARPRRKK